MTASILDGQQVAAGLTQHIKQVVLDRCVQGHRPPGLAVILLGDDPASRIYVKNKRAACAAVGFHSEAYDLPAQTTEQALLALIDRLNEASTIDGILIQLPLPAHINTRVVIERVNANKDVDGFHPYNLGRLAQGNPWLRPCTPYGVIQLLTHYNLSLAGKEAVVIGASNIVGRPMALELLLANATVTICHAATRDLKWFVQRADLIVSAVGIPDLIHPDWLNSKQILVDVGIHRTPEGHIRGDLDFNRVKESVAWITPVPGGVGPMTISTLLQNTLLALNQNA